MKTIIGAILFIIFMLISFIHFYWGVGGKRGLKEAVPAKENGEKIFNPTIFSCFLVAIIFSCLAIFILVKGGILYLFLPEWISQYGLVVTAIIFLLRAIGDFKYVGFFKKIKNTDFGKLDTKYYSPLCIFIGSLELILYLLD